MAATTPRLEAVTQSEMDNRIKATVMGIREEVMKYFKGTCVERLVDHNVHRIPLARMIGRLPYQYQRNDLANRDPQVLMIGDVPIATLERIPETITLHTQVMRLTPGLLRVDTEVRCFLDRFLSGVPVRENDTLEFVDSVAMTLPAVNDYTLFRAEAIGGQPDPLEFMQEYVISRARGGMYTSVSIDWSELGFNNLRNDIPF